MCFSGCCSDHLSDYRLTSSPEVPESGKNNFWSDPLVQCVIWPYDALLTKVKDTIQLRMVKITQPTCKY